MREYRKLNIDRYKPVEGDGITHRTITLDGDQQHTQKPKRRLFVDWRATSKAFKHLDALPQDGESLHGIINGTYALWEMVPGLIERTGENIAELTIATLSYSSSNAADILDLLDEGRIGRLNLFISYWFSETESGRKLYDSLIPQLLKRQQVVCAVPIHCKLILARMTGGAHYVCEASCNLRACGTIEQFVLTRDKSLYDFHAGWMKELEGKANKRGRHGEEINTKTS